MVPVFIIKILILGVLLVVLINVLLYKIIVATVIHRYIKPYLNTQNLILQRTKFVGLFKTGDFDKGKFIVNPVPEMGKISNTTFFYVDVTDKSGNSFQYTAKVVTIFFFVRKVILKLGKSKEEVQLSHS
ncbi:MAG: hypothetical protein EOO42_17290 [Flavobacteriales bacterium]|nr:MAG: hypothetical protein EOO42_17290 [Flavobacteriales bacterium]